MNRDAIASGDLVIKNGVLRDELRSSQEKNVGLYFETEVAGASIDLPYIAIHESPSTVTLQE